MDRHRRDAILIRLTEALRDKGSWCGETHLQKAVFFLQQLMGANLGFDFILYKHGPFSFDLRDELAAMRADGMIAFRIQHAMYGPSIVPEANAESLKQRFPKTLLQHELIIGFVARKFEKKSVVELEKLGTALYVLCDLGDGASIASCAHCVNQLKPHISLEQAAEALRSVLEWRQEAEPIALPRVGLTK